MVNLFEINLDDYFTKILFLELISSLLSHDFTDEIRESAYRFLLADESTFNFSKAIIFKALPAEIINQNLCKNQPIFRNSQQYFDEIAQFHIEHSCFKCVNNIVFEEYLETGDDSFDEYSHLPEWIGSQMLFENEPINYPDCVEQFYSYYVLGNIFTSNEDVEVNWQNCKIKKNVEDYYLTLASQYKAQHEEWIENMSNFKKERFLKFKNLRKSAAENS